MNNIRKKTGTLITVLLVLTIIIMMVPSWHVSAATSESNSVNASTISNVSLKTTKYIYDGKVKTPTVVAKDKNGNVIKSQYYNVSYEKGRKNVGRYKVTVKFKKEYSGTKILYFVITPKAPSKMKAELYGNNDVKLSWNKSHGAKGYNIYFKKHSKAQYTYLGRTTATSFKKANLAYGTEYDFKVKPYFVANSVRYVSTASSESSVSTMSRIDTVNIIEISTDEIELSWDGLADQDGYQISQSKTETGVNVVKEVDCDTTSLILTAENGVAYYYKVRSYITVGDKKICGPWTSVKEFTNDFVPEYVTATDEEYFEKHFEPVLRFAVASDVHVDDSGTEIQENRLKGMLQTAYDYSAEQKYNRFDGVFIAGDFTNRGTEYSMQKFFEIFESNLRDDTIGRVLLGNHEFFTEPETTITRFLKTSGYEDANSHMVINGYHFLFISNEQGGHFSEGTQQWLDNELAAALADDPSGTKPIFVFHHPHIYDTVYGSIRWGIKELTPILNKYPQVVDFSGHSHYPISDPRSVWQGEFTALGTGGLNYSEMELAGVSNDSVFHIDSAGNFSYGWAGLIDADEYYIVEVDARNAVRVLGYDLGTDQIVDRALLRSVGDPEKFRYTDERIKSSEVPWFPEEMYAKAENIGIESAKISFAQAKCADTVQHYRVELYHKGELLSTQYKMACWDCDIVPEKLTVEFGGLDRARQYNVKIIAVNPWGKESRPYTYTFKTELF